MMAAGSGLRQAFLHRLKLLRAGDAGWGQSALPLGILGKSPHASAWWTVFVTIAMLVAVP